MPRIFVAPLIGKGTFDDPIRPAVRGNFAMASTHRDMKRVLVVSEEMPQGAREAHDKDFEEFGVRRGWIRLKEK